MDLRIEVNDRPVVGEARRTSPSVAGTWLYRVPLPGSGMAVVLHRYRESAQGISATLTHIAPDSVRWRAYSVHVDNSVDRIVREIEGAWGNLRKGPSLAALEEAVRTLLAVAKVAGLT
jgi:hypothetical protein